jgi:hypothetical protein
LLGNPLIWWGHLVLLTLFTWIYAYNAFRAQRGYAVPPEVAVRREETLTAAGWLFLGKFFLPAKWKLDRLSKISYKATASFLGREQKCTVRSEKLTCKLVVVSGLTIKI